MWQILQKDILACADEFDSRVAGWASEPIDIASVAELNNKLQRLVSGAKLNKAICFADFIKALQTFLENRAGDQKTLDDTASNLLTDTGVAMRELAAAETPAGHYENSQQNYQGLARQLAPQDETEVTPVSTCEDISSVPPTGLVKPNDNSNTANAEPQVPSIVGIFLQEVDSKCHDLIDGLLKVEKGAAGLKDYEEMMRNAHSLKGGARLSGLNPVVGLTHDLEDVFSAAQQGKRGFSSADIDLLMRLVDLIQALANSAGNPDNEQQTSQLKTQGEQLLSQLSSGEQANTVNSAQAANSTAASEEPAASEGGASAFKDENLQNIIRMVSDMKIDSQRLLDISKNFQLFYKRLAYLGHQFSSREDLLDVGAAAVDSDELHQFKEHFNRLVKDSRDLFDEYEQMSVNNANTLGKLSREALACRMGVFGDCLQGIARLVRDLSKKQHKQVELVVEGSATPVDRDIIKPFIPALIHLVQNAIDHGVETPAQRIEAGKSEQARLTLRAEHRSGYLNVTIADDGRGVDLAIIKHKIVAEGMASAVMVERLSEDELLSFIFLPRFTLKKELTQVSGRGVGLDVVHSFIVQAQGKVKIHNQPGQGVRFEFRLPVSLATIRCVVVDICEEIYALPVSQIDRVTHFDDKAVYFIEGRPVIGGDGDDDIYLFRADQQLGLADGQQKSPEKMIVLKSPKGSFGLMVNRVLEEVELVDRPLHEGLGKLRDVRTASALPDGTPVLILDVEDLITNMEKSLFDQTSSQWQADTDAQAGQKRVLVVDDSLTVREVERSMLMAGGYYVDVAVDGVDGWNHLREGSYDLLVSDIDMPRMNGWQLLEKVRSSANMASLPVIVVSYKDRPEDFERGLEAGANSYVTKGSFQDDSFMQRVKELIGTGKGG